MDGTVWLVLGPWQGMWPLTVLQRTSCTQIRGMLRPASNLLAPCAAYGPRGLTALMPIDAPINDKVKARRSGKSSRHESQLIAAASMTLLDFVRGKERKSLPRMARVLRSRIQGSLETPAGAYTRPIQVIGDWVRSTGHCDECSPIVHHLSHFISCAALDETLRVRTECTRHAGVNQSPLLAPTRRSISRISL